MRSTTAALIILADRRKLWSSAVETLRARFAGSVAGMAWTLIGPLLLMGLYASIYLVIFRIRVPELTSMQYVLYVLCGLMPFLMTSEAISTSTGSIAGNRQLLENTVFPVALMPAKHVLASQGAIIAALPVAILGAVFTDTASPAMLLLPVVWALHLLALFGICWILAILNVFIRDTQQFIGVVLMALLIASPFAYTPSMVPDTLQPLIYVNPLAYFVITYQSLVVYGEIPALPIVAGLVGFSIGSFTIGSIVFDRLKAAAIDHV